MPRLFTLFRKLIYPTGLPAIPPKKNFQLSIQTIPVPSHLSLPLIQSQGIPISINKKVGSICEHYELIGSAQSLLGIDHHAPVACRVQAVKQHTLMYPYPIAHVELECNLPSDKTIQRTMASTPSESPELRKRLCEGGFIDDLYPFMPLRSQLQAIQEDKPSHLIITLLDYGDGSCTNTCFLKEQTDGLLEGIRLLQHAWTFQSVTIIIDPNHASFLKQVLNKQLDRINIRTVHSFYPGWYTPTLLAYGTGYKQYPNTPYGSPQTLVLSAQLVVSAHNWLMKGIPMVSKVISITGDGVKQPGNYRVSLGTSYQYILEYVGSEKEPEWVALNGSMSQLVPYSALMVVHKQIYAIHFVSKQNRSTYHLGSQCIGCGECTRLCPAGIEVERVYRALLTEDLFQAELFGFFRCIHCQVCDYACPSRIPLSQFFKTLQTQLLQKQDGKNFQ
jgi:Na+-translocating ferredoxin:NAD+ oxidoreductase subunit C